MDLKRLFKRVGFTLTSLGLVYLGLFLYPQLAFGKKITYKSFEVYSHDSLDAAIYSVLDSAQALLNRSEFYKPDHIKQKIFVTSGFNEYTFWAFTSSGAFAVNQKLTNNIFLAQTNIAENVIKRNSEEYNVRSLSGVIAHETTHALLRAAFDGQDLTVWENEGYCDYVANESSFPTEIGLGILCNGLQNSSGSFDYFKYRLFVTYLITTEHLTFRQILAKDHSIKELEGKIRAKYCQK